ncbi:beta-2-microglobulin-like isoform 1-T1 [Synchiropus picturatus]
MKTFLAAVLFFDLCLVCLSTIRQDPMVQVYSRNPGRMDEDNVLICHVSNFHPPEITINLLKNGEVISEAEQSDLSFEDNWQYHLIKHATFTPTSSDKFACRVTHEKKTKEHSWEPDE